MMAVPDLLEALLKLPELINPQISPDGKFAAWGWSKTGPAIDIFYAPTEGNQEPVRLTQTSQNTGLVSWTPDSKGLLVQQDNNGNERFQLFRVTLSHPLELMPLSSPNPPYFLRGGQLHPEKPWLIYAANFNFLENKLVEPFWLYRQNLETGERLPLAKPFKAGGYTPKLNSSGSHLLYTRHDLHPGGSQVWLVDLEGEKDFEFLNFGAEVKVSASWFPDGRRICVMQETETHRKVGICSLDNPLVEWILDDSNRFFERAFVPEGSAEIVLIEVKDSRVKASLLDPVSHSERKLLSVPGNLVPLAPIPGTASWVGTYYSSRQPSDLVVFNPESPDPVSFKSLTRVWSRTTLTPEELAGAEDFRWYSTDGLQIQGWLYRAPGNPDGTVILIHGGPTAHAEDRLNLQVQYFVSKGFNVLLPNYRGSTGFSQVFKEKIKEDGWGGREQEDIKSGIEALINARIAEAGKVGITGTSYGGYSSWCAITRWPPEIVAASAPICGMTDLVVDYETTRPDLRPYSEEMMGGRPDQVPEKYRAGSPINFVNNIQGNLLIIQGLQDPNVTPENVKVVQKALQDAGIKYEVLAFENEGHGISRPENQRVLLQKLHQFFRDAFSSKKF